jgi:hypothetical protein
MRILITKISQDEHKIEVYRQDGSRDSSVLNSRSFLRHDFAHFAVEAEIPIEMGYWGLVAAGASLSGEGFAGKDIALAETMAGPIQTLIRTEAAPDKYLEILERALPQIATLDLAERIFNRARSLTGQWRATPFGSTMSIAWNL